MPDIFKKTVQQLNDFWNGLERKKRIRLVALISLLLVLVIALVALMNRKEYVTLYTNLNPADAGEIMQKLEEMNIDAKPVNDDTIMVLKEQEPGVRMQLSSEGYPKSGLNYDLFMNSVGFGTTDFEKRKYLQFQLQDRLQEAIRTLNGVKSAIVTISLPEESSFVFEQDERSASASVLLTLEDGYKIAPKQVKAIEELLSKSVLGLSPENISIIDSNLQLLNSNVEDDSELASNQYQLENQIEDKMQRQIISLLEPVFGYKNVLAAVNVKLNFDSKLTETTRFEPVVDDKGIVVSMTELKEKVSENNSSGVPGQDSNGDVPQYVGGGNGNQDYEKVTKTVNYEINQIKEQIEKAKGQVEDLSVSVVLNSTDAGADMGSDIRERVQSIVAGAVGIDPDNVVVDSMAFSIDNDYLKQLQEATAPRGIDLSFVKDIVLYLMLSSIMIIVMFLIYRVIMERMRGQRVSEAVSLMNGEAAAIDQFEETPVVPDVMTKERKQVKDYIDDLIQKRPEEVAQLLRTWLNED